MIYHRFKTIFYQKICFQREDISCYFQPFDKNNLTRWCKEGVIIKLRNGYYSFPEYAKNQEAIFHIANQIYPFSYISLHTALAYHGYIANPPALQIGSVAERKTTGYKNPMGNFNYQHLKESLLFGYEKRQRNGIPFQIATPEKALLDIFYLFPHYYDTEQGIRNFALEGKKLYEEFNVDKMYDYLSSFGSHSVEKKAELFVRIHGL